MFSPCQKGHNRRIARYIWTFFFLSKRGIISRWTPMSKLKKMVNKSWLKTDMISNHFLPFVTWNDNLNEGHVWKPQVRGKPGRSWYINPFFNIVSMPFWESILLSQFYNFLTTSSESLSNTAFSDTMLVKPGLLFVTLYRPPKFNSEFTPEKWWAKHSQLSWLVNLPPPGHVPPPKIEV